ncbi:hypothetical protein GJ744_011494 [Endocarpon pusillum]|uniref:Uncharacterized protein n=1 Tax=Endocarpon pusillum TaxID=364733 RepID=A0A8H7E2V3_9EURO|nr:hypothetical protein GJ744_011494 [Endocarpon pusillum]
MLSRLFSWLTGQPIEPTVRQTNLHVLRIPADGSPPHLVQLNTIESDDNIDCCQLHNRTSGPTGVTEKGSNGLTLYGWRFETDKRRQGSSRELAVKILRSMEIAMLLRTYNTRSC